jgi:hypothetical protein
MAFLLPKTLPVSHFGVPQGLWQAHIYKLPGTELYSISGDGFRMTSRSGLLTLWPACWLHRQRPTRAAK